MPNKDIRFFGNGMYLAGKRLGFVFRKNIKTNELHEDHVELNFNDEFSIDFTKYSFMEFVTEVNKILYKLEKNYYDDEKVRSVRK